MANDDLRMWTQLIRAVATLIILIAGRYLYRKKFKNVTADLKSRGIEFNTIPVILFKRFQGRGALMVITNDKLIFLIKNQPSVKQLEISYHKIFRISEIATPRWKLGRPFGYRRTLELELVDTKYQIFLQEDNFAVARQRLSEIPALRDKLRLLVQGQGLIPPNEAITPGYK
jgi:hypothetical protein